MDDRVLQILLKIIADTRGADEVKGKMGDLGKQAEATATSTGVLGSAIGAALGLGAVTAVTAIFNEMVRLVAEERRFAEEIAGATDKLAAQSRAWTSLARDAQSYNEAVKIGLAALPAINDAAKRLAEAQAQLTKADYLRSVPEPWAKAEIERLDLRVKAAQTIYDAAVGGANFFEKSAESIGLETEALKNQLPVAEAIAKVREKIRAFAEQQAGLSPLSRDPKEVEGYYRLQNSIDIATNLEGDLIKKQERQQQLVKEIGDQTRLNLATGNEELQIQEKVTQAYDRKLKSLKDAGVPEAQAKQLATEYAESVRQAAEVRAGAGVAAETSITALLSEESTLLQGIRQRQELIGQNPFLSVDDKQSLLLEQYQREIVAINADLEKTRGAIQGGGLDPAQLEQAKQKYLQLVSQANLLGLKVAGIKSPFKTEIIAWGNSFGTAAHQAASALTNTLGTAINTTSQALTGLIFRTGNWREAVTQAAQSIVADLIKIGLQFIISRTLMSVINRIAGTADTKIAQGQASQAFAAWEPAAIAASTASYGAAAGAGLAAFLAAVASGQAAAVATVLHVGGAVVRRRMHGGGLAHDEVPIIAQEGEIMIQRSVAQQPGMPEFLLALNAGMLFHGGGRIRRLHEGGDDFDPASWADPLPGGPIFTPSDIWGKDWSGGVREPGWAEMGGDAGRANAFLSTLGAAGWGGLSGQFGNPWGFGTMFGSTASPTLWVNYPGVGAVPMAIPFGGWSGDTGTAQQHHAGFNFQPHHSGGRISRFHLGGAIARAPRLHSGGPTLGSSRLASGAGESGRAPQVNFYAFTDLRKIAEHAARSHVNRKVIMDTVTGNRIDLGI